MAVAKAVDFLDLVSLSAHVERFSGLPYAGFSKIFLNLI